MKKANSQRKPQPLWAGAAPAAVRSAAALLNRPAASARLKRALAQIPPPYRINVGAGRGILEGWLNTDVGPRARLFLDVASPWRVPPGSVSHVMSDHLLPCLSFDEARRFLHNAHDALAPGGILRIATPDAGRTARIYLHDPQVTGQIIKRHRRRGYADVRFPVDVLRVCLSGEGPHWYLWDFESLSAEMALAGFVSVRRMEAGESADPVLQGLERRSLPEEAAVTLVVEGIRGGPEGG